MGLCPVVCPPPSAQFEFSVAEDSPIHLSQPIQSLLDIHALNVPFLDNHGHLAEIFPRSMYPNVLPSYLPPCVSLVPCVLAADQHVKLYNTRVILILTKFGILISTWFQVVPFGLRFSKQFLFLMYDPSFCCP